jgi:hypothetical protein
MKTGMLVGGVIRETELVRLRTAFQISKSDASLITSRESARSVDSKSRLSGRVCEALVP